MADMDIEVASTENSYVEEGYEDYGGNEGYECGDGQGYGGQECRVDAGTGQQVLLEDDIDNWK